MFSVSKAILPTSIGEKTDFYLRFLKCQCDVVRVDRQVLSPVKNGSTCMADLAVT